MYVSVCGDFFLRLFTVRGSEANGSNNLKDVREASSDFWIYIGFEVIRGDL